MSTKRIIPVLMSALFMIQACGGSGGNSEANVVPPPVSSVPVTSVDADGNTDVDDSALADALLSYTLGELTEAEQADLLFMREEEKLAHDVYLALANLHGLTVFTNIAESEATHTEAVKLLLERYALDDPAAATGMGEFTSAVLQTLYTDLVDLGTPTLNEALTVGVLIEELDIVDLDNAIERLEENDDIELVYSNLQKGSRNHLRSFYKQLTERGGNYTPQYLTQEAFDAIVNSEVERGH